MPIYRSLVYLPPEYDAATSWPLLVYLHGSGERGSDLDRLRDDQYGLPGLIERGRQCPMIVVSPQCPAGKTWHATDVLELVDRVVDRFSVDPDRVYLTGYSMGGQGTWEYANTQLYQWRLSQRRSKRPAGANLRNGTKRAFRVLRRVTRARRVHLCGCGILPQERRLEAAATLVAAWCLVRKWDGHT